MDTKALRQKILDLAIRGKLVPQNPNDEPASVLLDRIRAEKQQMVKDGKLKAKDLKNDTIIFVGDDNLHYEKFSDGTIKCIEKELNALKIDIPKSWNWVRLGHIFMHNTGKALNSANQSGELLEYITTSNLYWNRFELQTLKKMYFTANEIDKCTVKNGDLLVCEGGDIGRAAIWNFDYDIRIQNHIHKLRPYVFVCTEFFYYLFYSYKNAGLIGGKGIGLQGLSSNALHSLLFPIPPVQEQLRITSAINSLFSSIDSINANRDELKALVNTTKSKILDLAIRGKLVPQDPNDEPASVLLERIRKEKEELIKTGKLKRDKRESVIFRGEDNSYYLRTGKLVEPLTDWSFDDLPTNWEICCFGEICNYGDCINTESSVIENSAWILDLEDIEKDTGRIISRVSKAARPSISTKHKFHKGQVLYSKLRPYLNKVVLADRDGYCTSEILPLEFHAKIIPEYARYYLMSPTFLRYADKCSYGVKMPRLGTNDGKKAIFPLPPVNEQKRIVKQIEFMFSHLSVIETSVQ